MWSHSRVKLGVDLHQSYDHVVNPNTRRIVQSIYFAPLQTVLLQMTQHVFTWLNLAAFYIFVNDQIYLYSHKHFMV